MGLVKSKYKSVATNSSPPPLGIRRQTVLLVFDTFEWWWDCCDFFRRWSDPDWDHHQIFLREKSALRQLGKEVKRKLGSAFDFVEMTLEEDLRMGKTIPSYDVAVLLQHDWPTVNENPTWLVKFTHFVQMSTIVPSYNCVFELFNKTNYLRKILAANRQCRIARSREGGGTSSRADLGEEGDDIRPQGPDEIPILRTILVDPDTDLQVIARRVIAHFPGNQIILKENFSAGKEGVSVIKVDREKDPKGTALQQDLEAHRYIMQSRSNLNQVISPSFVVQEFEPLFETSAEIRMYYIEGVFKYAVDHVGWIGPGSWPSPQRDRNILEPLQRSVSLIMRALPALKHLYLVRFDFGPNGRLNEVEIFPDLFGGPDCDLRSQSWAMFRDELSDALVRSVHRALTRSV